MSTRQQPIQPFKVAKTTITLPLYFDSRMPQVEILIFYVFPPEKHSSKEMTTIMSSTLCGCDFLKLIRKRHFAYSSIRINTGADLRLLCTSVGRQKCGDRQVTCTSRGSTGNLLISTFLVSYFSQPRFPMQTMFSRALLYSQRKNNWYLVLRIPK